MSLRTQTILEQLAKIPAMQKIKVTVQHSLGYGAIVGTITAVSGLIAGPLGIAAGGILSSGIVAVLSKGKFSSAPQILLYETTAEEKEALGKILRECLNSHHIHTVLEFVESLKNDPKMEQILMQLVITFLSANMGRTVMT